MTHYVADVSGAPAALIDHTGRLTGELGLNACEDAFALYNELFDYVETRLRK